MMKKTMMMMVAICLVMAASAQHGHAFGGSRVVVVSPGIGFGYGPFYSPFGYSAFGYPYGYPYGYNNGRSSRLEMQVEDIKADYKDKIKSAKQDKSLSSDERKNVVQQLKSDRDKAIHDLKTNYYKPKKAAPAPEDKG